MKYLLSIILLVFSTLSFADDFFQMKIKFESLKLSNSKMYLLQELEAKLTVSDFSSYCELKVSGPKYEDIFNCRKASEACYALSLDSTKTLFTDDLNLEFQNDAILPLIICKNDEQIIRYFSKTKDVYTLKLASKDFKKLNEENYGFSFDELTHTSLDKNYYIKTKLVLSSVYGDKLITEMKGTIDFVDNTYVLSLKDSDVKHSYKLTKNSDSECFTMSDSDFDRMIFYDFGKMNYLPLNTKNEFTFCKSENKRFSFESQVKSEIFHFFYKMK